MPNMSLVQNKAAEQPADVRNKNFSEVSLGFTEQQAIDEAKRCLGCKNRPCVSGCPVGIAIPDFLAKVAEGDFEGAYDVISKSSSLPAVCGRVCPQETQCEHNCVRGIKGEPVAIGKIERFVADRHKEKISSDIKKNGHKIAVVGSGPAGLSCAGALASMGYSVTVFEALHTAGGVLVYGIPEFRLPKSIVAREVENLRRLGVEIVCDTVIGKTVTVDELMEDMGYEAVFIGSGAGLPNFMNIPGENLKGVYSANEFLTRINLMGAFREDSQTPVFGGKHVIVSGGGNVAMDAARCAKRLGGDVTVVYRRTEEELPARREEVLHAKQEGIHFLMLSTPVSISGDDSGFVSSVKCQKMTLGEPDASGRRRPVPVENGYFDVEADSVIIAIGTSPNPLIKSTTKGLETKERGGIVADEGGRTTREGVFAGGDAVTGAATVILAMGAGKTAAHSIDEYIKGKGENQ